MRRHIIVTLFLAWCNPVVFAQEPPADASENAPIEDYGNYSFIGSGTNDLTNQLNFDAESKDSVFNTPNWDAASQPWYEWKASIFDRYGFQFTLAYSALAHFATETRVGREDVAVGGVLDFGGTWALFNRGGDWQGLLGFRIADQHKIGTSVAPAGFGDEIGSAWGTSLAFDDIPLNVIEGWWEQRLSKIAAIRFGKFDASGLVDAPALGNPFEHFMGHPYNLNSTIPFPAEGIAAIGELELVENVSLLAAVIDANGNGKDWDFDSFFDVREYLKTLELGWSPDFSSGPGEYHITVWESDERVQAQVPEGNGYTLYAEQRFGNLMPFVRYGHSSGGAAALKNMVAAGVGWYQPFGHNADGIGLGFSWGEPFGDHAGDQSGVEAYYRVQLTNEIAVTSDIQYIKNPANNPDANSTFVFSIRIRAAF
jgi:porin